MLKYLFEDTTKNHEAATMRLQAEFPKWLSRKSGISILLLNMLRPFVQNSAGPIRLGKISHEFYMLRYDKLKLQYLDAAMLPLYCTKSPTLKINTTY
jgi:hypothetical protein